MEISPDAISQVIIRLEDTSQVGEARRRAGRIAERTGLSEGSAAEAQIIATELGNNLLRHARGGEIMLREIAELGERGIELLAVDRGPGMENLQKCLEDGYSTIGTAGTGFGAVKRLSGEFDAFSAAASGTVVVSRICNRDQQSRPPVRLGVVAACAPGETVSGDGWRCMEHGETTTVLMVDGLGHGPLAAEVARESERVFEAVHTREPRGVLERLHEALRGTRGAAGAVARIDRSRGTLIFAGIGNISGWMIDDESCRGLLSHNGTLGVQTRKIQELEYPWKPGTTLVLHSDGIATRWQLQDYAGLRQRHPAVVAGVLFRDFRRGRDDATILVIN